MAAWARGGEVCGRRGDAASACVRACSEARGSTAGARARGRVASARVVVVAALFAFVFVVVGVRAGA